MSDKLLRLQRVFREVFDDQSLRITETTSHADIPEWDSVATVQLVIAAEAEFGVRLSTEDVASIKSAQQLLAAVDAGRA